MPYSVPMSQAFSISQSRRICEKKVYFTPHPDSLPHLHTFNGSIYTLQYLQTSPYLRTVELLNSVEQRIMEILPKLPADLVACITNLAFTRLEEVSAQLLELININFTNLEKFEFYAMQEPLQVSPFTPYI